MKLILVLIVLATIFKMATAVGYIAVYTSTYLPPNKVKCFAINIDSVVINAWNNTALNENVIETLANAYNKFPNPAQITLIPSGEGESDSVNMIKQLNASKSQYDFVWVEVSDTTPGNPWSKDINSNVALLGSILDGLESVDIIKYGIFTNKGTWERLFDKSQGSSNLPLWDNTVEDKLNFKSFRPFGGWNTPVMKILTSGVTVCDIPAALTWYPNLI